jgi:acyl-homoserine-lactone acylase
MRGLPIMNINYVDRYDTLFFIHNTVIPNRNPLYNWRGTVPGNTAETLWDTYLPLAQNPQILNPACGYTYNVNHSPFLGTAAADAPDPKDYPGGIASFDIRANNRSLRFEELLQKEEKISMGCLQEIRNDLQLPKESEFWHNLRALQNIDLNIYPDLTDVVTEMRLWNGSFDTLSTGASVAYLALIPLFERFGNSSKLFCYDVHLTEAQAVAYLRQAQTHLRKHFATTHLPFGKLQRLQRGNKNYPIGGCPDVLAAMYGLPQKDGTFKAARGDDFIMFVQFDKDKPAPTVQTMRAYGNSARPESPHYNDQMELFLRKQPRPCRSFDAADLRAHAERIYHPRIDPIVN